MVDVIALEETVLEEIGADETTPEEKIAAATAGAELATTEATLTFAGAAGTVGVSVIAVPTTPLTVLTLATCTLSFCKFTDIRAQL